MKEYLLSTIFLVVSLTAFSQPYIEVLSLNLSESLPINSLKTIQWNSSGVDNVKIEYTADFNYDFENPNDWQTIASSVSASSGTYQWTVPNQNISMARIRITDVSNTNVYDINDMDFSIYDAVLYPKNLKITSPNGGELLDSASTWYNIAITVENTYSEIEFQYSTDNGTNWLPVDTLIANGIESSVFYPFTRSYNWKVPNVNSNQCKLRVRDVSDNSIMDESDQVFSILADPSKSIEVLSFNATVAIPINSLQTINWNASGIDNVRIEYTANFNWDYDSPADWQTIVNSVSASSGTYQWTIPNESSSMARIRISDVSNSDVNDINDVDFSTYDAVAFPKNLKITSPNGGEIIDSASTWYNITLKYENTYSEIEFQYTIDNGINWIPIDTLIYNGIETIYLVPSFRSYTWKVPNVNSSACKIRVRDKIDHSLVDESDQTFSVLGNPPKSIEVISLNSSVALPINSVQTINWNVSGIDNVKIEYTANFNYNFDNPNDWQTIASSVSASSGTYQWTVPNESISMARIRITDVSNTDVNDINDMDFSTYDPVSVPKDLEITPPNGGEVLRGLTEYFNIALKTLNTYGEVEFQYSIDNGSNWIPIDTLIYNGNETSLFFPTFRSFNWKVPNVNSDQCKIRVHLKSDHTIFDESDNVFSIVADTTSNVAELVRQPCINIYPNPSKGMIRVISDSKMSRCEIYSATGMHVLQKRLRKTTETAIDIRMLPPGTYIISIQTSEGVFSSKLVKI